MTGTEQLTELAVEHTRLLAENEGLKSLNAQLLGERAELYSRVSELEIEIATMRGTLSRPPAEDDQPAIIHHDVPPNAPR